MFVLHSVSIRVIGLVAVLVTLSGCQFFRGQYSPLEPFSPQPTTLGQILPQLEQRWAPVGTYQAQGAMALSGEGVRGTVSFRSNTLYESPANIRVRASRGPKTVFEVLQTGSVVSIVDGTEEKVYVGAVEELLSHPGIIGGIEPLEIARALLIGQSFMNALNVTRASGGEVENIAFENDRLALSQVFTSPGETKPNRLEEYVVRREDGLIEGARLVQRQSDGQMVEVVVQYDEWGIDPQGMPYPKQFVIHSQAPKTELKVEVEESEINPKFTPQVFWIDQDKYEMRPLEQLLQPSGEN